MKELSDSNLELVHQRALKIYKARKSASEADDLDGAIVLAIFAILNPENDGLTEEEVQEAFTAYKNFALKKILN